MSVALSVKTAASETELSETTIRKAIDSLELPAHKVGRVIRIDPGDLKTWFKGQPMVGQDV